MEVGVEPPTSRSGVKIVTFLDEALKESTTEYIAMFC